MIREDNGLPFLLKYENVAWYSNGAVKILDRRIYPTEINYVYCHTYQDVAQAIADMVTQSAGPYTAAGMGMALAAHQCKEQKPEDQIIFLKQASSCIGNARPTTSHRMLQITESCVEKALEAIDNQVPVDRVIFEHTIHSLNRRYSTMNKVAKNLLELLPNPCNLLTQCFGETIIGMLLKEATLQGRDIKFFCAETRPYFQGARLTASCCAEMGFETTLLTDNMILFAMENLDIDVFTSAADTITQNGWIANKIGTKQIASLANLLGIPYFVTGIPDKEKISGDDIIIEYRDPLQVLEARGIKNTIDEVKAIYPSFDITPPHLIASIVTDKGGFSPYGLTKYFETDVSVFY